MPEMDGYEAMRRDPREEELRDAADHRAHRQGDEGRSREVHRGRRLRLHHQAGRHRTAPLAAARMALPLKQPCATTAEHDAVEDARARAAPRGGLPPVRVRLPRLRADVDPAAGPEHRHERGAADRSARCRTGSSTTRPHGTGSCWASPSTSARCSAIRTSSRRSGGTRCRCCARIRSSASGRRAARSARRSTRWPSCCRRRGSTTAAGSTRPTSTRRRCARRAKGIYPADLMQKYTQNYMLAGGQRSFSEYYTARYEFALMRPSLQQNIVFSQHNLVSDGAVQRVQRDPLPQRDDLLQPRAAGAGPHALPQEPRRCSASSGWARRRRSASCRTSAFYEQFEPGEKLYRRIA